MNAACLSKGEPAENCIVCPDGTTGEWPNQRNHNPCSIFKPPCRGDTFEAGFGGGSNGFSPPTEFDCLPLCPDGSIPRTVGYTTTGGYDSGYCPAPQSIGKKFATFVPG